MKQLRHTGPGPLRLDRFLAARLPGLPPAYLHKALRQNKIKVNGKKQPLNSLLQPGDEVRLYLPPDAYHGRPAPLAVVFEDEHLLVVDKPAGLVSVAPDAAQDSLLKRAKAHTAAAEDQAAAGRLALCHRLDTGTCGLLLLAKTPEALAFITGLMHRRLVEKNYLAVVVGHPAPAAATLHGWLQKDAGAAQVRVAAQPRPGARKVTTRYQTLATAGPLALLSVDILSGRTHQIRAHLAAAGTPLLGDSKYGILAENRRHRCRYQCLCAHQLALPPVPDGPFARYGGRVFTAAEPWFAARFGTY